MLPHDTEPDLTHHLRPRRYYPRLTRQEVGMAALLTIMALMLLAEWGQKVWSNGGIAGLTLAK